MDKPLKDPFKSVQVPEKTLKYEMNLAEFPLGCLSLKKNLKPLKFQDTVLLNKVSIKREWTIDGSLEFGTPRVSDEKTLITLIRLAEEQKCFQLNTNELYFTTYGFCKSIGWPVDGPHYQMFRESLIRLFSCKIRAKNSFWDKNRQKLEEDLGFGVIEDFKIYGIQKTGHSVIDSHVWEEKENYVRFNQSLFSSIRNGYLQSINPEIYRSLTRPLSERLYIYLVKKLYKKETFFSNVRILCFEHLGMTRNDNLYHLKRKLDKANQELKDKGFLKSWKYQGEVIIYQKGSEQLVKEQLEQKRTAAEEKQNQELLKKFETLNPEDQEKIRSQAKQNLLARGIPETFLSPFLLEIELVEVMRRKEIDL